MSGFALKPLHLIPGELEQGDCTSKPAFSRLQCNTMLCVLITSMLHALPSVSVPPIVAFCAEQSKKTMQRHIAQ